MIKSGNPLFERYGNEITCIYGEASTGKTTLAKLAGIEIAKKNLKVVYVDTEGGFSVDRFRQLAGEDFEKCLENMIIFKPTRFREQFRMTKNLLGIKNVDLIIIDTICKYYRVNVREKPDVYNLLMRRQLEFLKEISKKIPVIITNQVYTNIKSKEITMIGNDMFKKYSGTVIRLEKEPRKLLFEKPQIEKVYFGIDEKGVHKL